jgi:hypothetical protein
LQNAAAQSKAGRFEGGQARDANTLIPFVALPLQETIPKQAQGVKASIKNSTN